MHRAPIISLFSGAGGLDLGFERAGFEPLVAYDIFPAAVRTYNHNRTKDVACRQDLAPGDAEAIISDLEARYGSLAPAGVIAGPPCQAFSHSKTGTIMIVQTDILLLTLQQTTLIPVLQMQFYSQMETTTPSLYGMPRKLKESELMCAL